MIYKNYSYESNYTPKKNPSITFYRCDQHYKLGCPGRAKVDGDKFIELRTPHNHDENPNLTKSIEVSCTL